MRRPTLSPAVLLAHAGLAALPCLALVFLALVATGCSRSEVEDEQVDAESIETMLRAYLPKLGAAYAEQDPTLIEELAVPKEVARIELRIDELATQGQVYKPEFKEVTVEDVSVWNYSNAFVTTLEVWDVRSYSSGSETQLQEVLDQRSRVKYQLKRKDDSWVVLYRELDQTFD